MGSAADAMAQLAANDDVAAALIDVVMETDDAGLLLVEHIRKQMKNEMLRIIIRTGQPGAAPERYVIEHRHNEFIPRGGHLLSQNSRQRGPRLRDQGLDGRAHMLGRNEVEAGQAAEVKQGAHSSNGKRNYSTSAR